MKDLNLIFEDWRNFVDNEVISEAVSESYLRNLINDTNRFEIVALKAPQNKILLIRILKNLKETFEYLEKSESTDNKKYHKTSDVVLSDEMKDITSEERIKIISFLDSKIQSLSSPSKNRD